MRENRCKKLWFRFVSISSSRRSSVEFPIRPTTMKVSTMFAAILVSFYFNPFIPVLMFPDSSYDSLWIAYKIQHHKTYDQDNKDRREIWEENARKIAKHNLEADMGLHSYHLELNKFSDMTASELDAYRKCLSHANDSILTPFDYFKCDKKCFKSLPESVDWREKNLVTPVKDQGECGSCWAFSSTGALEGQNKIKSGILISLSEQNLIDCSEKQGNHACDGGWMDYAFQYVIDNNGLDTEEVYPYKAKKNHHCNFIQSGVGTNCTRYVRILKGSEKHLRAAVALIGPVSVAIDASEDKFMSYKDGVYYDKACSSEFLDHAVLVVGYGTLNGTNYWIVKNSWGSTWGMNGYILMARNARNMCGIASHAVFPVI